MSAATSKVVDCPFCAEEIKAAAKVCKHCKLWIDPAAAPKDEARPEPERVEATVIEMSPEDDAKKEAEKAEEPDDLDGFLRSIDESDGLVTILGKARNVYNKSPEAQAYAKGAFDFLTSISRKPKKDA